MDVAELQVVNKASNLVSDTPALPVTKEFGPLINSKQRSFAIDEWTIYDKVCVCVCVCVRVRVRVCVCVCSLQYSLQCCNQVESYCIILLLM